MLSEDENTNKTVKKTKNKNKNKNGINNILYKQIKLWLYNPKNHENCETKWKHSSMYINTKNNVKTIYI